MRLNRLNGWQRLWLVATCLALVSFGFIYPLVLVGESSTGQWEYRRAIAKDFDTPVCRDYATRPISQLIEPPYGDGGTCWHIYTSRKHRKQHGASFTLAEYDAKAWATWWEHFFIGVAFCGAVVLSVSALVYFLGCLIAWIRRGFVQRAD